MNCPGCGREISATDNFCAGCGRPLVAPSATSVPEEQPEQRLLTIMFCDLVGSTELAQRVDPEELRSIVKTYYGLCDDAIARFGGHVVKHIGDGAMAYFGYPIASDDDAASAIQAGLAICSATRHLTTMSASTADLNVRVGINTGPAIVGIDGSGSTREALSVGDAINVAARIEGASPPGRVTISEATRRMVEGHFDLDSLGATHLKGVAQPVPLFAVNSLTSAVARGVGRHPFVGRRSETERLRDLAIDVRSGLERYVTIVGEPGIGKSRFVEMIRHDLGFRSVSVSCMRHFRNSNLHSIGALVEQLDLLEDEATDGRLDALARHRSIADDDGRANISSLALFGALDPSTVDYTPQARRSHVFQTVADKIRSNCSDEPLLVVIEDLHWADPSTIEFLTWMSTTPVQSKLLVLMPARPDLRDIPGSFGRVHLDPLGPGDVLQLVETMTSINQATAAEIVARADGVPLFVEELVKALQNDGLDDIPMTLQASITAQLDRLGTARRVAQLGSLFEQGFRREVIAGLLDHPVDLDDDLALLTELKILALSSGGDIYSFRHALVREAAASSMIGSVSRRQHADIARFYEGAQLSAPVRPETTGQHWALAGDDEQALPYFSDASARAVADYANHEALAFLDQMLDALDRIVGDRRPSPRLADIHSRRGDIFALLNRKAEAEAEYGRALDQTNDPASRSQLFTRIALVHQQDQQRALVALDEAEMALVGLDDEHPTGRDAWLSARLARMRTNYWFGRGDEMTEISVEMEAAIAEFGSAQQRAEFIDQCLLRNFRSERYTMSEATVRLGSDYVLACEQSGDFSELAEARFTNGFILLFCGRLNDAIIELDEALELARRTGNRAIEVRVLAYQGTARRLRGDTDSATVALVERSRDLATAEVMVEYAAVANANLASFAWSAGDVTAAVELSDTALDQWQATGMAWPFGWLAALPRLAAAVADHDVDVIVRCCMRMDASSQQALARPVSHAITEVLSAAAAMGHPGDVERRADALLRAATESGLLANPSIPS